MQQKTPMTIATHSVLPLASSSWQACSVAAEQFPLLEAFYRSQGYKLRLGRLEQVWAVQEQGQYVAAMRLLPQPDCSFWLRNMLVTKPLRGQGVGRLLLNAASVAVAGNIYCFALPAVVEFYRRLGFVLLDATALPEALAVRYNSYRARGRDWVLMGYSVYSE